MAENSPDQERRQFPRADSVFDVSYELSMSLPVSITAGTQVYPALAIDVGAGGIGLDADRELAVGTSVKVIFELANMKTTKDPLRRMLFRLDGQVRNCAPRKQQKKRFRIGVQFLGISDEQREFITAYIKDLRLADSEGSDPKK